MPNQYHARRWLKNRHQTTDELEKARDLKSGHIPVDEVPATESNIKE